MSLNQLQNFRLVSKTSICDEVRLAVDIFQLSKDELWELISNGFESSFMPGSYANKLVSLLIALAS